ncbi:proline and serine-rich protein 2 isoform X1 [Labrus mixtus]|uniref:proline and serine-rich protein 2 isoform X1 n=2 Tax=Labrus mixtus TaxID=508554 RepID=UPI0029C0346F|nr:proline and serine-rich protein 2 isoform X1 [Labrus mixtus]XP_060885899.1 proline and serine-rich protein 2 isoform X1 [Labrus mixtus]
MTSDPRSMDLRLQANPQLHYGVNGGPGRNARPGEDDALQFLSREEQECLKFFEKTIDSLEDGLEDNDARRQRQLKPPLVDEPPVPSPMVSTFLARPPSHKDHDIIDLVRPDPDLLQTREPIFNPTNPDFHSMVQAPESHFEIKPRRDPVDSLPSEYNPPLPSGSYGSTDSHSSYHPPGSVPTPVLIAQKIAENQVGGNANISPSLLLRRCSLELEKPPGNIIDPAVRQGPPTSTKPSRFPANISLVHGSKEHQSQSLPNVSINERRAQMLANLTGTAHPLLPDDTQHALEPKARNTPSRSISFKDPEPDKSRLEALSKLGLNRTRAMSGGMSLLVNPDSASLHSPTDVVDAKAKPVEASVPQTMESSHKLPEPYVSTSYHSQIHADRKPEILRTDSVGSNERFPSPPPAIESNYYPPPLEIKAPSSPEIAITSPEFNRYGGKSIVIKPSVSSRSEPTAISPTSPEPKTLPPALAHPSEFNDYGGKTKVMNPVAMTRSDLPDILSSHINKSQSLPAKVEPTELNSYGGKSRVINPSTGINRPSVSPARSFKAPAPTPAPKPPRNSYHGAVTPPKAAPRGVSPEKRRSSSMFRPQSITVKFSGKGATDESRRDALRKLGLLKDS